MRIAILLGCLLCASMPTFGQQYKADAYAGMRWRLIGPHRAGRVTAVAGIRGRPGIYYMGTPGGGVWKTTDGGQVWKPIFDEARVASIGALAVAPSNPQIIYVGTGEQTEGNGVYKSTDAGATWTNIGLGETRYISSIIVDPRDPNIVLVGVSGKPVPGQMRGIFKTTDGGKSWNKVFFKDDRTGVVDMCAAPGDSRIVYAATWTRQFDVNEPRPALDAQIFKSTDAGATWRALGESGLPSKLRGRIGVVVAPGDKRVYAIMNQGFFRSDDGGESWTQSTKDPRVVGSGYFSRVYVDPKRADVVYVMQTTMYRSVDGGKTFEAYRGAPSGEDEHVIWIDPDDTERMILGTDQGAIVSLNGGQSWSLWYNQPTGQFYHVITDKEFPYYAYASQQDSGSVVVPNRSDFGEITFRDWFSTGSFESGYIAPDPLDANLIYSIGWFGTVLKMDRTTKQISTMFIPGPKYRFTWETPIVFSPKEPKNLYLGMQHVLRSTDGAATWREISPDLTERPAAPAALKNHADDEEEEQPQSADRGVIQAIAPSPLEAGEIWVGTSTGLVQLTTDGGATWRNVTPRELPARSRVFLIEPSVRDAETAYAVAAARNDLRPHIYRTRDGGKNWQQIVAGLPERGIARVVREDPVRKGLAYAGTENGAYVSFDAGDHWQPLQLNLPTASVRDLTVHESDLVAATYGRGLWILDNLSPLRQLDAKALAQDVHLFRPETALRVRWDNWQETPLSAETPAGQNPPDGAIIDYYLKSSTAKEITLEIRDERGNVVRRYSSAEPPQETAPKNVPEFWFAPPARLTTKAGLNRFVWDLRYPHPATLPYGYSGQRLDYIEYTVPDNAIPGQTPSQQPPGPLVAPGKYEAVLTVEGKTYRQPLVVVLDPRVRVSTADLEAQLNLARKISGWMTTSYDAYFEVEALQSIAAQRQKSLAGNSQAKDVADALTALEKELVEIKDGASGAAGVGTVNRDLARYMAMIESGDTRPPESARNNTVESCDGLGKSMERWRKVNTDSLPVLNKLLAQHGLAGLPVVAPAATPACLN